MDPFLLIHPPLSIAAHLAVFINTAYTFGNRRREMEISAVMAWIFSLCGLITGMIWAQMAWGAYWSWDPKENASLMQFLSITVYLLALDSKASPGTMRTLACMNVFISLLTIFISRILLSLHSHY